MGRSSSSLTLASSSSSSSSSSLSIRAEGGAVGVGGGRGGGGVGCHRATCLGGVGGWVEEEVKCALAPWVVSALRCEREGKVGR